MNNYVSDQPDFSQNLGFSDEMRRLKMMSQRARFGLTLLVIVIALHNFSAALEIATGKKVFFGVGYL